MGASSLLEELRHLIGSLGWRLYIWGHFGGDEERFHYEMEVEVRRREAERFRRMAALGRVKIKVTKR